MTEREKYTEQVKLRLPPSLKQKLSDAAWNDRRTINALVVMLLEKALGERQ